MLDDDELAFDERLDRAVESEAQERHGAAIGDRREDVLVVEPDGLLRSEQSGRVQVAVVLVADRAVQRLAERPPPSGLEHEQTTVLPRIADRPGIRDRGETATR